MQLKSIIFAFFITATSISSACSDKYAEMPLSLTIEEKTVNFETIASSREILVKTNIEDWTTTVQGDAVSWLEARRYGSTLRITANENKGWDTRRGEIKVAAGNLSETIIVEQLGVAPAILLSAEAFTVEANGGEMAIEIISNVDYDIIVPTDISWIEVHTTGRSSEMVTRKYPFHILLNNSETQRQAEITVKQKKGTIEKKALVIQKGQTGYNLLEPGNDIKADLKVPVSSGKSSSFQQGENIEKSFDGNMSTIYHSAWENSDTDYFPITLEYFFENQESIDYLVYYPRTEGHNGFFKETEIWVSTQETPSYTKLLDYDFKGSGTVTRINFEKPLIYPQAVKFIVKSGQGDGQGFVSCAEMEFYRKNPDNFNPLTLFTDATCSVLKPDITLQNIEKVSNNFYRNIAYHLYKGIYPSRFRIETYKAWPHPDNWARTNKTTQLSLLDNPTGISVNMNEELVVFVGETGGYPITLKVQNLDQPNGDGYQNASYYTLSSGINKLKMRNKGLIYVFYHTPEYQTAPPVKIHFATGKVNGYFDSQKHQAADWNKLLNNAADDYFDVLGQYAHLTFPTALFKQYTPDNGKELIDAYDDLVRLEAEFMGLNKYNRPTINRAYFHAMHHQYMYATEYRTAYNVKNPSIPINILDVKVLKKSPWGPAHELGHTFQTRPGFKWLGMTEVSNNLHSLYVQTGWGNESRLESENMERFNNRYEKAYYNSYVKKTPHPGEEDVFCKLISLWQLQLYFTNARGNTDIYKDLYEIVRTSPDKATPGEQQLEFVKMICDITQTDMLPFFAQWGYLSPFDKEIDDYGKARFLLEQHQIDQTIATIKAKNYPPLTDKIEYICDSNWEIFKNRKPIQQGTAVKNGATITMTGWKNVVAYEVYESGKLVFVSNRASFTPDNPATTNTKVYAVAYDGTKMEVKF